MKWNYYDKWPKCDLINKIDGFFDTIINTIYLCVVDRMYNIFAYIL